MRAPPPLCDNSHVGRGMSRYLGAMGHCDHLPILTDPGQELPHASRGVASHTYVNFIQKKRGRTFFGHDSAQRQGEARQLSS